MSRGLEGSDHTPLWQPGPDRIAASNLAAFLRDVNQRRRLGLADYAALQRWSVADVSWRRLVRSSMWSLSARSRHSKTWTHS